MSSVVSDTADVATLEQALQTVLSQAHTACATNGEYSSECTAAWAEVEEIQTAIAERKHTAKSPFDRYCETRPDALECRIYDV